MSGTRLIAGAMSGTSADGVDVAIARIEGEGHGMSACLMAHHHRPYDAELRRVIFEVRRASGVALGKLADLARQISIVYAAAVNEALLAAKLHAGDLACVAAHGQTLFHEPPLTMQWLDPALLAAEVGCPVVSDFRRADCAAGGQGAPLVPFADYVLFRHARKNRVLVNIGGIANLTFLPAGGKIAQVKALDSGPGNCISDYVMRRFDPLGQGFDRNGELACRGRVMADVADRLTQAHYFRRRPPKSTDGPDMIRLFEEALGSGLMSYPLEDLLATACRLTAVTLAGAIRQFLPVKPDEMILSGGGTSNHAIIHGLAGELKGVAMLRTDDLGIAGAAKEAIAFALLGAATLDGVPANVPAATGARRPVVLGAVTARP